MDNNLSFQLKSSFSPPAKEIMQWIEAIFWSLNGRFLVNFEGHFKRTIYWQIYRNLRGVTLRRSSLLFLSSLPPSDVLTVLQCRDVLHFRKDKVRTEQLGPWSEAPHSSKSQLLPHCPCSLTGSPVIAVFQVTTLTCSCQGSLQVFFSFWLEGTEILSSRLLLLAFSGAQWGPHPYKFAGISTSSLLWQCR